jgi:hypothetical protein
MKKCLHFLQNTNPTTTSLVDIRMTTRYVSPAYSREQQEAVYVTSLSDRR